VATTVSPAVLVPSGRGDTLKGSGGQKWWIAAGARLVRDRLTLFAIIVVGLFGLLAVFAGTISQSVLHVSPTDVDLAHQFEPPSGAHLLGTDDYGRDQLARLLFGARVSLSIGLVAAMINLTIGVALGLTAAFYGRIFDDIVIWLVNTLRSIPSLFLLIIVASLFKVNATTLAIIIGLTSWAGATRLVRGQVFEVRER
jgi:peptide/nickel transport system permease protein